jgi:hypothetical protein
LDADPLRPQWVITAYVEAHAGYAQSRDAQVEGSCRLLSIQPGSPTSPDKSANPASEAGK